MRRWNGWGNEATTYSLPDSAARYLAGLAGEGLRLEDASLARDVRAVPPTRLSPHPVISSDYKQRLFHARCQSLPDWIALRSGQIGTFRDGIMNPGKLLEK